MNKKVLKPILIAGASLMGLGTLATAITAVSCSNSKKQQSSQVVQINAKYASKKAELQNTLGLPKVSISNARTAQYTIDYAGEVLVKNAQDALAELTKFKSENGSKISLDERIWLDSYIYNWETEINNWKNGLQYLGGNPSGDALPLNPNSNHLDDNIASTINIYDIDPDTLEPIPNQIDEELAKNYVNAGKDLSDYIISLGLMLNEGMKYGVMPNNITKKLFVNQMLKNYYPNELLYWSEQVGSQARAAQDITLPVVDQQESFTASNSLLANFDAWKEWATKNGFSTEEIEQAKLNLTEAQKVLDEFITWYADTYYTNVKSFGVVGNAKTIEPLKVNNTNSNNEIERTISIFDPKTSSTKEIYGLGVTDAELNLPNVGIGFMKSTLKINNEIITGNKIYQALLQFNNSVNKTAQELVETGIKFVQTTTNNMQKIAEQVALLNNPSEETTSNLTWNPSVMYDENIGDDNKATEKTMNIYTSGKLNLSEFNKWLNQENFFFGRETKFWSQNYNGDSSKTNLVAYTTEGTNEEFNKYLTTLETLGYAGDTGIWTGNNSKKPIYGNGSVNGEQALAGAVLSLVDYNNFKNASSDVFNYSFNDIPDYAVAPYNQKVQDVIGVGLEGPRGSNIFNYNVNPYFSLPKWSQSSFQNHEGKMGHHTQQAYWTKYMPKGVGQDQTGPGYAFKQDAFHEGWAVFAEWYANELNLYGSKLDEDTRLPSDWLHANGFVPEIKDENNPTQDEINVIKNFQASAYWEAASGAATTSIVTPSGRTLTSDQAQAVAATKIANMLQYYGYLNEAQLRNMRLAVDPLYHYNDGNNNSSGTVTNTTSTTPPAYGASIKQVRTYLQNNSGLGQGDIQSESYRYLNMPSQATGYMTGKVIFENCYKAVKQQYETQHGQNTFLKDQKAVRQLFDLFLRNGEIPLDVVENAIESFYNLQVK